MKKIFLIFYCLLIFATNSIAANWYVRPSGGSGSGTSWTNAWNGWSGINWSSVGAGDTIWVAGGSYGYLEISSKSGSSGSPITMARARSDSSACTGAAGWSDSYSSMIYSGIIRISSCNYFNISGCTTASGGTQGWKIERSSGDYGMIFPWGESSNYNLIEFLEVKGPAVYPDHYNWINTGYNSNGIIALGGSHKTFSHVVSSGWASPYMLNQEYYLTIEYGEIYNVMGGGDPYCHPNTLYIINSNNGIIRYNKIYNATTDSTGIAFSDGGHFDNWQIYGNVFYDVDLGIAVQRATIVNVKIYNNTFWNVGTIFRLSDASCSGGEIKNNASNDGGYSSCGSMSNNINVSSGSFINVAGKDFRPVAATGSGYLRNAGTALETDGYINKDMDGNLRGEDGTWDAGAFEYSEGGAPPTEAPIMDNLSPTGILACSPGDPRSVTITATTDQNAIMKYDIVVDENIPFYSDMTYTFANTGGMSHSTTLSLACGASYSYYVKARNTSLIVSLPSTISFSIASPGILGPGGIVMGPGVRFGN